MCAVFSSGVVPRKYIISIMSVNIFCEFWCVLDVIWFDKRTGKCMVDEVYIFSVGMDFLQSPIWRRIQECVGRDIFEIELENQTYRGVTRTRSV